MNAIEKFINSLHYGKRLRPEQDWFALLAITAALLVLSIVWNLYLFEEVETGAVLGNATAQTPTLTGSQESLNDIQQAFAARAVQEANYETGGYTFIDPSQE